MKTKVLLRIGSGNECNEFPSELNYLFAFPRPRLSCSPSVLGKTGLYVDNDVGFHSGEGEIQKSSHLHAALRYYLVFFNPHSMCFNGRVGVIIVERLKEDRRTIPREMVISSMMDRWTGSNDLVGG